MLREELKRCPFCGGKAEIVVGLYDSWTDGYAVRCCNCCLTFGAHGRLGEPYEWTCIYESEEEAIDAWNTRVSHACYADEVTHSNCKYSVHRGWCENTCKIKMGTCSKCNHGINNKAYFVKVEFDDGCYTYESRAANYCPNCGAKILKE